MTTRHIPQRFFSHVHRHLYFIFGGYGLRAPILAIVGPPGEGKSLQLEDSLRACNTAAVHIFAGDLESFDAGRPTIHLIDVLQRASSATAHGAPTAVVVHDIDTTLGEWESNTGTVNHQQLLSELMSYADQPDSSRYGGRAIPIFVTANDLGKVYAPLRRSRRTTVFRWLPSLEEKVEIVSSIIGEDSTDLAQQIVDRYPDRPVAFFDEVIRRHREELVALTSLSAGIVDMRILLGMPHREGTPRRVDAAAVLRVASELDEERRDAVADYVNWGQA